MTPADWGLSLSLGLVSSLHCMSMCGPIVLAYGASVPRGALTPHLAYNLGRISTYSLMGAAAGWLGQGAGWLAHVAGAERWLALAGGVLLIVVGLAMLGIAGGSGLVQIRGQNPVRGLARLIGPFLLSPNAMSKLALGLGLGFLPCGLVYAALAKAATTGDPGSGAATMFAFGLGTAGALLVTGLGAGFFGAELRRRLTRHGTRLAAVCVIVLGLVAVWRGIRVAGSHGAVTGRGEMCHVQHGS